MTMAKAHHQREYEKFKEDKNGDAAVNTISNQPRTNPVPIDEVPRQATVTHVNSTATTISTAYPTVAGENIIKVKLSCPSTNQPNRILQLSYDGGANFISITVGGTEEETMVTGTTQIHIKANNNPTLFELVLFRELP